MMMQRIEPDELRSTTPIGRAYTELLDGFVAAGYEPGMFTPSVPAVGTVLVRHDVDFDIDTALAMAEVETTLGVRATYFFLMRSHSYNLLEPQHVVSLHRIRELGHEISIHFDPTPYTDIDEGMRTESAIFERIFGAPPQCVSIHRPPERLLGSDDSIGGLRHTYQPGYFERSRYFSDSQGAFRYGHPLASQAFRERRTIQLLIHPVWWRSGPTDPIEVLDEYAARRAHQLRLHMAANCIPYRSAPGMGGNGHG